MTRTQLREMPRQDLIEYARRNACHNTWLALDLIAELADRLDDLPRVDDYPFNAHNPEGTAHV